MRDDGIDLTCVLLFETGVGEIRKLLLYKHFQTANINSHEQLFMRNVSGHTLKKSDLWHSGRTNKYSTIQKTIELFT